MRSRSMVKTSDPVPWAIYQNESRETCSGTTTPYDGAVVLSDDEFIEFTETTTMDDVVTPEFLKRRNQGLIINNPMSKVTTIDYNRICNVSAVYGIEEYRNCSPWRWITVEDIENWGTVDSLFYVLPAGSQRNFDVALPALPVVDPQVYVDQAVNSAWSRVGLNEADVLTSLAESQKTIYSIVAIFTRFVKVLRNLKQLRARELVSELSGKEIADRYMEMRYALRPLVYDFNNVVTALNKQTGALNDRLTFRGFADNSVFDEVMDPLYMWQRVDNDYGVFMKGATKTSKTSINIDVRAGVLTQLTTESKLPVWGLTMPIEAAWELTPFSFIIDWFLNCGDTISAWTPNFGLRALSSWSVCTVTTEQAVTLTNSWASMNTGSDPNRRPLRHGFDLSNCQLSRTIVTKTRVPNPTRAIMPSVDLNLDVLKLADLLIIAKKIISSSKR